MFGWPGRPLAPPVVAHLYQIIVDTDREGRDVFIGGRGKHRAGSYAEARAVTRTGDLITFHRSAGQGGAVMGADILDRVELAFDIENRDRRAVDVDHPVGAGTQLINLRHIDPVTHRVSGSGYSAGPIMPCVYHIMPVRSFASSLIML